MVAFAYVIIGLVVHCIPPPGAARLNSATPPDTATVLTRLNTATTSDTATGLKPSNFATVSDTAADLYCMTQFMTLQHTLHDSIMHPLALYCIYLRFRRHFLKS